MEVIIPLIFILMIILIAGNYAGDYYKSQSIDDRRIVALESNQKIIFADLKTIQENNEARSADIKNLDYLFSGEIDALQNITKTLQKEILKNRVELRLAPQGSGSTVPGDITVPSQTPFLTLSIEKTEWLAGSTIIFTGTGIPEEIIVINMFKAGGCGQQDICSLWVKVDNNSNFRIEFETFFDDPIGTWKAYVKQGDLRSETIEFEVTK